MMKILSAFIFSFTVLTSANAEVRPATPEDLNGMVNIWRCSGALVSLGRSDAEPGLILSAGHCPGPSTFYLNGEAEINTPLEVTSEKALTFPAPTRLPLRSVYYATMTHVDASLFETRATLGELRAAGHRIFDIADRLPKPGEKLRITSGVWSETEDCEVERIIENDAEERELFGSDMQTHTFRNSVLFKRPCSGTAGWSGAPTYNPETGLIYGVVSRLLDRVRPSFPRIFARAAASGNRWALALNPATETVDVVASNLIDLRDCVSSDGHLALGSARCALPQVSALKLKTPPSSPRKAKKFPSRWPK